MVSKRGLEPLRPFERQPLKLVRLPISPLRRGLLFYLNVGAYARNIPSAITVITHTSANTVVMRFRFLSAAAEPSAAPPPPPNMSLKPPPRPLWSNTPTTRAASETTLMTRVRIVRKLRTAQCYREEIRFIYSGKWHADCCPVTRTTSSGSVCAHNSVAFQHLVLKRHPDGGFTGEGTSPSNMIRCRDRSTFGSGNGTADSSAFVYGCDGWLYTAFLLPISTIFPRYITATSSAMWRTTDKS